MSKTLNATAAKKLALAVIQIEARAIDALSNRINDDFTKACEYILACQGRVIVLGMGKSGHIGGKIAATLASTGCPAFFVHAGEASHGDMGMILPSDVVLAISNSGNTSEITTLLPLIKRLQVPLIAMTGNRNSQLGEAADVLLDVSVEEEACPLGLAPTSSTTATLVMGDALAIALLDARGFTADDFAFAHPGGSLGRRLLLRVSDVMHKDDQVPCVNVSTTLADALMEITAKKLGLTTIVDNEKHLLGVFTDGDLRRVLKTPINIHETRIQDVMTQNCKTVSSSLLAFDALNMMEENKITAIIVVDNDIKVIGVIHLHDIIQAGVV